MDSDSLPLNVSREMLQQHSSLKTIKKKLIRKALDMIRRLADEDPDESTDKTGTVRLRTRIPEVPSRMSSNLFIYALLSFVLVGNQSQTRTARIATRSGASTPSSGMSLANQSSSASLKMQPTGTVLPSSSDSRGKSLPSFFFY